MNMKSIFATIALAGLSFARAEEVAKQDDRPVIQVAILLDNSGSMQGLIQQAKTQIWQIVNEFVSAKQDGKTPRVQVGYDLFGNGKTALKVSLGKYVLATTPIGNPAGLTTTATRAWNDTFYPVGDPRRGNYFPDCDLINQTANAECGKP